MRYTCQHQFCPEQRWPKTCAIQMCGSFHKFHIFFPVDDLPKPQIMVHPTPTAGVLGKDVRLTCMVVSSSSSPMTFTWWKNQEPLPHAHVENFAHSTSRDRAGIMEYTTVLHLRNVKFEDEGRYQCVISNQFGSTYSNKASLSISGRFYFYTSSPMICFSCWLINICNFQ